MIGELGESSFTIIKAIVGFVALPPLGFITSVKVLDFISSFAAIFVVVTVVVVLVRFSQTMSSGSLPMDDAYVPREPSVPLVPSALAVLLDLAGIHAMFCI